MKWRRRRKIFPHNSFSYSLFHRTFFQLESSSSLHSIDNFIPLLHRDEFYFISLFSPFKWISLLNKFLSVQPRAHSNREFFTFRQHREFFFSAMQTRTILTRLEATVDDSHECLEFILLKRKIFAPFFYLPLMRIPLEIFPLHLTQWNSSSSSSTLRTKRKEEKVKKEEKVRRDEKRERKKVFFTIMKDVSDNKKLLHKL